MGGLYDAIQLANARSSPPAPAFAFGELTTYDPTTNTGQFALPGHPDPITGDPTLTGFIQLGTPHVGANNSGAQFPPKIGAQAKIAFLGSMGDFPLFDSWYFTDLDPAPFPDGKTAGWKDPNGSSITTTLDGPTPGDGMGAARVAGKSLAAATTAGGHQHLLDDVNQYIKTLTAAGSITLHSDITKEISHIPVSGGSVNLGALKSAMDATNAAVNQSHLKALSDSVVQQTLQTMSAAIGTASITAGIPNSAAFSAILSAASFIKNLPGINPTIPDCSSLVNISK